MTTAASNNIDVVILCGGAGTRLRSVLPKGTPKIMADIDGQPFVDILLRCIKRRGLQGKIILCTGYGYDHIWSHFCWGDGTNPLVWFSRDKTLLGTAGAIKNASHRYQLTDSFWILNGDTLCDIDYHDMFDYHARTESLITVAVNHEMESCGTYLANRGFVDWVPNPEGLKVDMEDVFKVLGRAHAPVGWYYTDAKYWDIGTPEGLDSFGRFWKGRSNNEKA